MITHPAAFFVSRCRRSPEASQQFAEDHKGTAPNGRHKKTGHWGSDRRIGCSTARQERQIAKSLLMG